MRTVIACGLLGLRRSMLAVVAVAALGLAFEAGAVSIGLSNSSSDPGVGAASLGATMDFHLSGSTLTLSVSNDSTSFDITGFYFNVSSNVTDITLTSGLQDWKLEDQYSKSGTDTGEFGVFDYIVGVRGKKAKNAKLDPGDVATFVFAIGSAGLLTDADFTAEISLIADDEVAAFVAARFGIDKDSPIGATHAPEPTTGLLVGIGMCLLAASRSRSRFRSAS